MRIQILGAGKMGSFFSDVLSFEHEVAVYDVNPQRLRFMYNCLRFTKTEEIEAGTGNQCGNSKIYARRFQASLACTSEGLHHQ